MSAARRRPNSKRKRTIEKPVPVDRRYVAMMTKSKRIYDDAVKILPGGVESQFRLLDPFPFYAAKASGSKVFDVDGNEYIDCLLSQGAILLGHGRKEVVKAVRAQADTCANIAVPTKLVVDVAKRITEYVPSVKMVRFANSGTEATMHAIRTARGFTGKDKIAKAEGGYHGLHDYVLWSIWGPFDILGDERRPSTAPFSRGVPKAVAKTVVAFPFNDIEATYDILHKEKDELAAVITEPVMANMGCLLPTDNYLTQLQKICNELGILLILDEVITGFRLSRGGAQQLFKIKPDLTTFGKALGGGYPLAAFGGRKDVMMELLGSEDVWPPKRWPARTYHGGTYNANPVSLAASAAVLDILADDRVYLHLDRTARTLFSGLQNAIDDRRIKAKVSSCGSMAHIYFGADEVRTVRQAMSTDWDLLSKWCMECLVRGVMFGHPKGEKMFVSDAHTSEDIDKALDIAGQGFDSIRP